jgi:hypothetical protein
LNSTDVRVSNPDDEINNMTDEELRAAMEDLAAKIRAEDNDEAEPVPKKLLPH